MVKKNASIAVLIIFILIGLVIGSIVGELLKGTIDLFAYGKIIGFKPFTVDLSFIKFTLGLELNMNLITVVGIIIALIIYKKI
ncbi:MAG: DUF4321 domain-containing protein [Clostridiales bacterium]|nr:DUF4321 domain-containing protein [Clostridiales bacterium]